MLQVMKRIDPGPLIPDTKHTAPYVIYQATNITNGKFYIGVSKRGVKSRARDHFYEAGRENYSCKKFHAAINKYGRDNFFWGVIDTANSFDEVMSKEVEWIAKLKPQYNICRGGRGAPGAMLGKKHSKQTVEKLRNYGIARKDLFAQYSYLGPNSLRKRVVCLNTGEIFASASETATKLGLDKTCVIEVCLKTYARKSTGGLVFRYYGDHFGGKEEVDKILSKKIKKPKPPFKLDRLGFVMGTPKRVICSNGIEHKSISEAARFYNVGLCSVSDICRGVQKKTRCGLSFRYM